MADKLGVAVVIPVYNAENYLEQAVSSTLDERDNGLEEVILVEDGSSDGSLELARALERRHAGFVRLLRHEGGVNKGVGASRNLGVRAAGSEVVCFLDADDYWLPGRLEGVQAVLPVRSDVDGVYDTVTTAFETEEERLRFEACNLSVEAGPSETVPAEGLFQAFLDGRVGWHTNAIAVRRQAFLDVGGFNPELELRQDGELWFRMAAVLRLERSPLHRPVAVYRRHGRNRFNPDERFEDPAGVARSERAVWDSLMTWMSQRRDELGPGVFDAFLRAYMIGLGRLLHLGDAWAEARNLSRPFAFLYAIRGALPGPRRIAGWLRYRLGGRGGGVHA